jgi:thioredoxin reductase (NADPH)
MFPELSSAQIARIASRGVIRPITLGEVLIDGGQTNVPFFVLKSGEIEVIRPSALEEILVAVVGPTQFTGDISMISAAPRRCASCVSDSGEVVQLTRDQMHSLIQTDAEISEVPDESVNPSAAAMVARGGWRRAAHRLRRVRCDVRIKAIPDAQWTTPSSTSTLTATPM